MREFIAYLESRISEGKTEIITLEADGRKDDANFARVRTNIYEVCRTVTNVLAERPGAGPRAVKTRFESFRASWSAALEKARTHGDARNVVVEETKLQALEDVLAHFPEAAL